MCRRSKNLVEDSLRSQKVPIPTTKFQPQLVHSTNDMAACQPSTAATGKIFVYSHISVVDVVQSFDCWRVHPALSTKKVEAATTSYALLISLSTRLTDLGRGAKICLATCSTSGCPAAGGEKGTISFFSFPWEMISRSASLISGTRISSHGS